jgi:hypothetical protein
MSKIYIEVRSGLGNQLFQFAFGYALAQEFNKELVLIPSYFDGGWKYLLKKTLGRETRLFRLSLIIKDKFSLDINSRTLKQQHSEMIVLREEEADIQKIKILASGDQDIYLQGYWQNPVFFTSYKKELSGIIQPSFKLSEICKETLNRIDSKFVAIHVRRGDFLTNKSFGACTINYYVEAIHRINSLVDNPIFVIFTNNKAWVKEHFPKDISYFIYSNDNEKNTDIEEMYLMTKFNSLIISNSTFSWWAAYLNNTQDKHIICPASWFLKPALQKKADAFILKEWNVMNNQLELLT